ncbi:MAG: (2Fe-2S)-binding protein [Pyrinomonadaceae bacterium]
MIQITVDGVPVKVEQGTSVAAALLNRGIESFRTSVAGESRQPLCGMGICFECRVTIDGESHQRSCMVAARDGMQVTTVD